MQRKAPSKAALRHCENQVQRFAPKCVDSFFRLFQFGTLFANQSIAAFCAPIYNNCKPQRRPEARRSNYARAAAAALGGICRRLDGAPAHADLEGSPVGMGRRLGVCFQ